MEIQVRVNELSVVFKVKVILPDNVRFPECKQLRSGSLLSKSYIK